MKKIVVFLLIAACAFFSSVALGETVAFGSYEYEPVTWMVLSSDENYTKLMSEYVINCMPFDDKNTEWSTSDVRAWLNDSFAYEAFSAEERAMICLVDSDLVRLPSLGDVTSYGFSSNRKAEDASRAAKGSNYAVSQGLWVDRAGYCSYYTLTPANEKLLYQVRAGGSINAAAYDRDNVGIRAVIIVKTSALQ